MPTRPARRTPPGPATPTACTRRGWREMAATQIAPAARQRVLPPETGRAGFADALRSEFTKIRSTRSTYWTLLALVVVCVGMGALASAGAASHASTIDRATFDATQLSLAGLYVGQLVIAVLGALTITSEYSTGMIRTTLSVQRRRPVPGRVRHACLWPRRHPAAYRGRDHRRHRAAVRAVRPDHLPAGLVAGQRGQVDARDRGQPGLGDEGAPGLTPVPGLGRVRGAGRLRGGRDRRRAGLLPHPRRLTGAERPRRPRLLGTGALCCARATPVPGGDRNAAKSRLTVLAPERDPALRVAPLVGGAHRGAAPAAGPARAAVDPGLLAAPAGARGDLAEPVLVRLEQPLGKADQRGQVGDLTDRAPRADAAQEQRLRLVHVADAGQVALVEQGLADRPGRVRTQPALRLRRVPVRAEQVGAEVADRAALGGGGQDLHDAEQVD